MSPTSITKTGFVLLGLALAGCGEQAEQKRPAPSVAMAPKPAPAQVAAAPVRPPLYEGFKTFHYPNGVKKAEGRYTQGRKDGRWIYWHPDGRLRAEGAFLAGKEHGSWTFWRSDGRKLSEGEFAAGTRVGLWKRFGEDGRMEIAQLTPPVPAPARLGTAMGSVAVRPQDTAPPVSAPAEPASTDSEEPLEEAAVEEKPGQPFRCPLFPRAKLRWGMSGEEFFDRIGRQFATYSEAPGGKAVFKDAEGDTMVVFGAQNDLDMITEVVRTEDRCQMLYNRLVARFGKPNIQVAVGRSTTANGNPIVNATWWTDSTEIHFHHPTTPDAHKHVSTLAFRPVKD